KKSYPPSALGLSPQPLRKTSEEELMKPSLLFLLSFLFVNVTSAGAPAFVKEHRKFLHSWNPVLGGGKNGNEMYSYSRQIRTKTGAYSVGQITLLKGKHQGPKNADSVRALLKKEFNLQGLIERKLGDAWRFEGYQKELQRQVVIFVSFEGDFIKTSSAQYRP